MTQLFSTTFGSFTKDGVIWIADGPSDHALEGAIFHDKTIRLKTSRMMGYPGYTIEIKVDGVQRYQVRVSEWHISGVVVDCTAKPEIVGKRCFASINTHGPRSGQFQLVSE